MQQKFRSPTYLPRRTVESPFASLATERLQLQHQFYTSAFTRMFCVYGCPLRSSRHHHHDFADRNMPLGKIPISSFTVAIDSTYTLPLLPSSDDNHVGDTLPALLIYPYP